MVNFLLVAKLWCLMSYLINNYLVEFMKVIIFFQKYIAVYIKIVFVK